MRIYPFLRASLVAVLATLPVAAGAAPADQRQRNTRAVLSPQMCEQFRQQRKQLVDSVIDGDQASVAESGVNMKKKELLSLMNVSEKQRYQELTARLQQCE